MRKKISEGVTYKNHQKTGDFRLNSVSFAWLSSLLREHGIHGPCSVAKNPRCPEKVAEVKKVLIFSTIIYLPKHGQL
jgi:hypothetical protein